MITTKNILDEIGKRKLELKSRRLSGHSLAGGHRSAHHGSGMHLKEVREYQPGDDIRSIEWNVSARMGHPYTKLFDEDRQQCIYILADMSASTLFGSQQTKRELICRLTAEIAYASLKHSKDKVGLLMFTDRLEKYIAPQSKSDHVPYLVKELLHCNAKGTKTDTKKALEFINGKARQRAIIFIVSDFEDCGYGNELGKMSAKHQVIGLHVFDSLDKELPSLGLLQVRDFETGGSILVDSSAIAVREKYRNRFLEQQEKTDGIFKKAGCELLTLETGRDYFNALQQLFTPGSK